MNINIFIKIPKSLKTPTNTHSPSFPLLPSSGYHISGKEIEVHGSGSPRFFPVIRARLAGLPWFPAPSAVSPGSPVLNPDPRGTFSWPTSKSPFTPFRPAAFLLHSSKQLKESSASLLHLTFWFPKASWQREPQNLVGPPSHGCHTWVLIPAPIFLCSPISDSSHNRLRLPDSHIFPAFLGCHSKSWQVWACGVEPIISKLLCRLCNQGELPPSYVLGGSHSHLHGSKHSHSYLTYP